MTNKRTWTNKWFRDESGKIVLTQTPNVPLWGWIIGTVLGLVFTKGKLHELLGVLAFGSIFIWAYLEMSQGINYFRRLFGLIVFVISVVNKLH